MSSLQLQLEAAQTDITRLKGDVYTLEQSTAVSSAALLQANADKKYASFCTEFCITLTSDDQPKKTIFSATKSPCLSLSCRECHL